VFQERYPDEPSELVVITTMGDRQNHPWFSLFSPKGGEQNRVPSPGKGLFVKELEEALLNGAIDLAVHSLKDLPTEQPEGLEVAAVWRREDPRDAFVGRGGQVFDRVESGRAVGTASLRRKVQLAALRPDLEYRDMKGNVDTRLTKVERGEYEGAVLALAGLRRLGLEDRVSQVFSVEQVAPAPGQGALGLEVRKDDDRTKSLVAVMNDRPTQTAVTAERACLAGLGGGCRMPLGAFGEIRNGLLRLSGVLADELGSRLVRASLEGSVDQPEELGRRLADLLLRQMRG